MIVLRWAYRQHKDARTWRHRVESAHANWLPLIPVLVSTYLAWKSSQVGISLEPQQRIPTPNLSDYSFSIDTVDIFTLSTHATFHRSEDSLSPVQALVSAGFLGNAPHNPSIAISLRTLEHYRLLRLRKPSLSVEAFAKVICDSYSVCISSMCALDLSL